MLKNLICVMGMLLASLPASISATQMSDATETDLMQNVISLQLDAFARDDATTAYAQASPVIQAKFQSKEIFMAMVRQGYAVLIQPQRVEFLGATETPDGAVFGVQVYARDGGSWIAAYQMVRDDTRNWRINGCQLMRVAGQQI
jgi:hypothetical protein